MSSAAETVAAEQPGFVYFECQECGFDSVQPAGFAGSDYCPMCEGDTGHSNRMQSRVTRVTDKPEGFDARKGTRAEQEAAHAAAQAAILGD